MTALIASLIALSAALSNYSAALASSTAPIATAAATTTVLATVPGALPTIEEQITTAFPDAPVMLRIARCESELHQFEDDGSVHRGEINPRDTGLFQINETYHLAQSRRLGMDIYTLAGNIAYARYLYDRNGTRDWNWSRSCWGT
jgi:hypothetical protein